MIEPGTYRFVNVKSRTSARSYKPYSPVYVSSSFENPGDYEMVSSGSVFTLEYTLIIICLKLQWDVRDAWNGGYTLQNASLAAWVPMRSLLWIHGFSGHIVCLTYWLLTPSVMESLKPLLPLRVLYSTLNLQATANTWVCLATFFLGVSVNVILTSYHLKIKLASRDLLLNAEPPVVPRGDVRFFSFSMLFWGGIHSIQIKLRSADGRAPYSKVNNNERWELL